MKKSYLLVYNTEVGTRDQLRTIIDGMPEVSNWKYELPYSFYLISELSAHELAHNLRKLTGEKGRFILVETTPNRQGWLDPDSWTFLTDKPDP